MDMGNLELTAKDSKAGLGAGAGLAEDMEGIEYTAKRNDQEAATGYPALPNEILDKIFKHLNISTLKNLCLAGSAPKLELKACAERLLYRHIKFKARLDSHQYPMIPLKFRTLSRTMRENLDLYDYFKTLMIVDDGHSFANPSNVLTPVTLTNGISGLLSTLGPSPWLHTLVLSTTRNLLYLSPLAVYEVMTQLPALKTLTIQGFGLPRGDLYIVQRRRGTSRVENLYFDNVEWMEAKTLAPLVQLCKELKKFRCSCWTYFSFMRGTAPALFEPYRDCLESLSNMNSHEFYDQGDCFTKFTALKELTIRGDMFWPMLEDGERIDDAEEGVEFIVNQFLPKGLKKLNILNSSHWRKGIIKTTLRDSTSLPEFAIPGGWSAIKGAFLDKGIQVKIVNSVNG